METSFEPEPGHSKVEAVFVFLMHQVIATGIIFFTAATAIGIAADLPRIIGIAIHPSFVRSVSRPPYFPANLLWAFFLGWSLSGFLRHRTMLWVWVLPCLVLGYLYIRFPNCPIDLFRSVCLDSPSAYSLFFGPNCAPGTSCLYQLYFTYPFLAAGAYSLGALLARRMGWLDKYAEALRQIRMPRACMLGVAFIGVEVAFSLRQLTRLIPRYPFPIWYTGLLLLFQFAVIFAVSTYIFMVVIGLIGRRFFVTRWFLNEPPAPTVEEPTAKPLPGPEK
jgi:hypothetical protein